MADVLGSMLKSFAEPGAIATGLPAPAYTDDAFWSAECERVLASNWVLAGFVHELPKQGDVVPVTVAGRPVILVHNRAGEITAFHNVCRHRCLQLVSAPQNTGNLIRCPYHAWAYGLDGGLRATPHFGGTSDHAPPGFVRADYGLRPVRTAIWHDWVFVNLSGEAPVFADYAESLIRRLDGIDFAKLKPIATLDFGVIETNWKFIMENFIEPYHVQFVHKSTTDQPLTDHYTIVDGNCLGSAVDLAHEGLSADSLAVSSRYLTLFPNFILGRYFPDQLGVYLNIPLGPNKTAQKRVLYTTDGQDRSVDQTLRLKQLWWDVHKEDHEMCERLQAGRSSPVAEDGGVLSPKWEDSVRAFQELVVNSMRQAFIGQEYQRK